LRHNGTVNQAAWSPDGLRVVTGADDGMIHVWTRPIAARPDESTVSVGQKMRDEESKTRSSGTETPDHESAHGLLARSPDGSKILRPGPGMTVLICDIRTGERVGSALRGHRGPILHASFSPDGTRVVTASADHTAHVWDAATGEPVGEPLAHASRVTFAVFSSSGNKVLTTGEDNAARLWDAATGELLLPPLWHTGTVLLGAFSSDGTRLATVCKDRTVRVWDGQTGEALTPAMPHPWPLTQVSFSADDLRLITTSPSGAETTWDLSEDDRPVEDLQALTRLLASQRIDLKAGTMPMGADHLLRDWAMLKGRYPDSFTVK
jgi:WD40 repeat protein